MSDCIHLIICDDECIQHLIIRVCDDDRIYNLKLKKEHCGCKS